MGYWGGERSSWRRFLFSSVWIVRESRCSGSPGSPSDSTNCSCWRFCRSGPPRTAVVWCRYHCGCHALNKSFCIGNPQKLHPHLLELSREMSNDSRPPVHLCTQSTNLCITLADLLREVGLRSQQSVLQKLYLLLASGESSAERVHLTPVGLELLCMLARVHSSCSRNTQRSC